MSDYSISDQSFARALARMRRMDALIVTDSESALDDIELKIQCLKDKSPRVSSERKRLERGVDALNLAKESGRGPWISMETLVHETRELVAGIEYLFTMDINYFLRAKNDFAVNHPERYAEAAILHKWLGSVEEESLEAYLTHYNLLDLTNPLLEN